MISKIMDAGRVGVRQTRLLPIGTFLTKEIDEICARCAWQALARSDRAGRGHRRVAVAAGPAAAEDDPGWVDGWLGDVTVGGPGAPDRTVPLTLASAGANQPRVTIDLTGLAGVATASFPDFCVTQGTSVTCPMPPTAIDESGTLTGTVPVVFRPRPARSTALPAPSTTRRSASRPRRTPSRRRSPCGPGPTCSTRSTST
ncbi:hypothetical protein NKG94_33665 [Micromonospora sp. M12]